MVFTNNSTGFENLRFIQFLYLQLLLLYNFLSIIASDNNSSAFRVILKGESESPSVVSNSLWPRGLYSPRSSLGQNTEVSTLSLLQGIFPTHRSNPGLPHCKQILYQLSYKNYFLFKNFKNQILEHHLKQVQIICIIKSSGP